MNTGKVLDGRLTLKQAHAVRLLFTLRTFDEAPGVVEFGLGGDVTSFLLFLILQLQDLMYMKPIRTRCRCRPAAEERERLTASSS